MYWLPCFLIKSSSLPKAGTTIQRPGGIEDVDPPRILLMSVRVHMVCGIRFGESLPR